MATRWPGVESELGIRISWRFAFIPQGTVTQPSRNTVYLDVGGGYGPGVIDHHQGGQRPESAASLLAARPDYAYDHLVASLPNRAEAGGEAPWRPTIVVHSDPDFDAIVTSFLLMQLVADGVSPRERWGWLVQYADRVDQGMEPLRSGGPPTLYPLILLVQHTATDSVLLRELAAGWCGGVREVPSDLNELRLCAGLYLVTRADQHRRTLGKNATKSPCGELDRCPLIDQLYALVKEECERYEHAKATGLIERLGTVTIAVRERPAEVSLEGGLIRSIDQLLALDKLQMRTDDPPMQLTVIRKPIFPKSDGDLSRWIIDACWPRSFARACRTALGRPTERHQLHAQRRDPIPRVPRHRGSLVRREGPPTDDRRQPELRDRHDGRRDRLHPQAEVLAARNRKFRGKQNSR